MKKNVDLAQELFLNNYASFFLDENDLFFVFMKDDNFYTFYSFSSEDIPRDNEYNFLFSDIDLTTYTQHVNQKIIIPVSVETCLSFIDSILNEGTNYENH